MFARATNATLGSPSFCASFLRNEVLCPDFVILCILQIAVACKSSSAGQQHPTYKPQYGSPSERQSLNIRIKVDFSLIQHLGAKCSRLEMVKYNGVMELFKEKEIQNNYFKTPKTCCYIKRLIMKQIQKSTYISDAVKYGNYRFQEPLKEVTIVSHSPHSKL